MSGKQNQWLGKLVKGNHGFFNHVVDSLGEGLVITDRKSKVIYVNRQFLKMTGFTKEDLIGKISHEILLAASNWKRMKERIEDRMSGIDETYHIQLRRKNHSYISARIRATPLEDDAGRKLGTLGLIEDLSESQKLKSENEYLRREIREDGSYGSIIGDSPAIRRVLEQVSMVSQTLASVLVHGESGTGKELVARAIHDASNRVSGPLIRVNCAAISPELFESSFFGHKKGAFTGADRNRQGYFSLANGGTLFLDEIGEIPLELQSKLLRVLQENEYEPVGGEETIKADVRIVAATNRNLKTECEKGRFREDLYFRLNVFPIELPPLRERLQDIELLAPFLAERATTRIAVPSHTMTLADIRLLQQYEWPGNIRELQHVIERALILAPSSSFSRALNAQIPTKKKTTRSEIQTETISATLESVRALERQIIVQALQKCSGRIYGDNGAAILLDIPPTTLSSKIKKLKISLEERKLSK